MLTLLDISATQNKEVIMSKLPFFHSLLIILHNCLMFPTEILHVTRLTCTLSQNMVCKLILILGKDKDTLCYTLEATASF